MESVNVAFLIGFEGKKTGVKGSKKANCHKCGKELWISPASQMVIVAKKAKLTCSRCIKLIVNEDMPYRGG